MNSAKEMLIAVQDKICDIAPPLVDLYACALTLEMEDNVEAAKDSGSVHAFYCIFLLLSRFVLPKEIFLPYTGRFYLDHSHHPFAQAHYRSMQRFYIDQALRVDFDLATKCILSSEAKADLEWWVANLSLRMGKRFFPKLTDLDIFSAALLTG